MHNRLTCQHIILGALLGVLLIFCYISLSASRTQWLSLDTILSAFFASNGSPEHTIILNVRLPRTLTAIFVGAALSVSGYFIKLALNNPIADSGVLGIQSGASTFALVAMLLSSSLFFFLPIIAFLGGLTAFILLILFAYRKRALQSLNLIITGIILSSFFNALNGVLQSLNKDKVQFTLGWLSGSVANISIRSATVISVASVILLSLAPLFIPLLKLIRLDDKTISNLGKNPYVLRFSIIVFAVLLSCLSVAYVGIIGFVGIIIPHFANKLVGYKDSVAIPATMLMGAILVLSSDFIQKIIFYPNEIPVGVIIGLIGTPLFLLLMQQQKQTIA